MLAYFATLRQACPIVLLTPAVIWPSSARVACFSMCRRRWAQLLRALTAVNLDIEKNNEKSINTMDTKRIRVDNRSNLP